jgi:hypothetical protein
MLPMQPFSDKLRCPCVRGSRASQSALKSHPNVAKNATLGWGHPAVFGSPLLGKREKGRTRGYFGPCQKQT